MWGRSVNLTTLFLGRLRPPKRFIKLLYLFHYLLNLSLAVSQKSLCVVIITDQPLSLADLVIRPFLVRSGKSTTQMVPNEIQRIT